MPDISRRLRQQDTGLGLEGWRGWEKNVSYRDRDEAASRAAREGKPLSFRGSDMTLLQNGIWPHQGPLCPWAAGEEEGNCEKL